MTDTYQKYATEKEQITVEEHYKILAEKDLQILLLKQRLDNATALTKSYADEFAKRGLVYIPHPQTQQN